MKLGMVRVFTALFVNLLRAEFPGHLEFGPPAGEMESEIETMRP
jgi:hypothetical protein